MKILDILSEADYSPDPIKPNPNIRPPTIDKSRGNKGSGSSRRVKRPKGIMIEHPDYVYERPNPEDPDNPEVFDAGEESWDAWYDDHDIKTNRRGVTHRRDFSENQKQQIIRNQELAKQNNDFNLEPATGSYRLTDGMGKSNAKVSNAVDGTNAAFDEKSKAMAAEVNKVYASALKKTGSEEKAVAAADNKVAVLAQKSGFSSDQLRNLAQSTRSQTGNNTSQASWQFSGKGGKEAGYDDPNRVASPALHDLIISKNPAVATPAWKEFQRRLQQSLTRPASVVMMCQKTQKLSSGETKLTRRYRVKSDVMVTLVPLKIQQQETTDRLRPA